MENTGHANNDTVVESAGLPVKVPEIPPTGDTLRTYRTALVSDPGYSTYHGGPQNVTAAKVALMNRVTHIYEDDLTIRLQLIANNDLLNLNTYAEAVCPERAVRGGRLLHTGPGSRAARPAGSAS